jgi:hypothetical protein
MLAGCDRRQSQASMRIVWCADVNNVDLRILDNLPYVDRRTLNMEARGGGLYVDQLASDQSDDLTDPGTSDCLNVTRRPLSGSDDRGSHHAPAGHLSPAVA